MFITWVLFAVAMIVTASAQSADWKLVWADEFDKDGLPDESKWNYEEGFVRNEEMQYYTKARKENARIENGSLILEGRKEQFPNAKFKAGSKQWQTAREHAQYTAASLHTHGKTSWTYGRIEMRAKLPQGKGVWPAFWMLGDNISKIGWPACGEIDIMEFVGHTPDKVHGTMHWGPNWKQHLSKGGNTKADKPWEDFHIYAVEWFEDRIDCYYDQTKYFTFQLDQAGKGPENPFRKPQYIILNLALGGGWGGKIDEAIFPQKYVIDYVRVYERVGEAKPEVKPDAPKADPNEPKK